MRNPSGGGAIHAVPGFLSPFRLSAFASWVILRPLGSCTFLTVGLPASICRTPTGLSCCTGARPNRAGRPLDPGDGDALPTGDYPPAGTRRSAAASPDTPLEHPIGVVNLHETSSRVHSRSPITPRRPDAVPEPGTVTASRRSSPRLPPPNGTTAASASTPGFAPRGYPRRTPRRRQAIAH
jgi:hypothetical protein